MKTKLFLVQLLIASLFVGVSLDVQAKNKLFKGQISLPNDASYYYEIFDNDGEKVGSYEYHIKKTTGKWLISSNFDLNVERFFIKVIMREKSQFDFDGVRTNWFKSDFFSSLPFKGEKVVKSSGKLDNKGVWDIATTINNENKNAQINSKDFIHFNKMIARFPVPNNTVSPNETESYVEYDYIEHKLVKTEAKGVSKKTISFKGKEYTAYVANYKTDSTEGEVVKFDNGVTYRVENPRGYTVLKDFIVR